MASVTIENAAKRYGAVEVIRDLSIDIHDGEFIVFVGPSGCGKSTLLRMVAGLESFQSGIIRIGERVVNGMPARDRNIAMVFQDYALYPHMTVEQNMSFGLKMRGAKTQSIEKQVKSAADVLQIGHLMRRKPRELSGGQRQRVAMGRSIVREPEVFLFDEPLSNLDAKLRVDMRTEIKRLHRQLKTTMIYVTHDQVEAMTMADRIVVMRGGNIEQIGTPRELYNAPRTRFVAGFIGSPAMNFLPAVIRGDRAELENGDSVPVRRCGDAPDGTGELGLRPEHLSLIEPGSSDDDTIDAVVDVVEPMGSDTFVVLRVVGAPLVARLPGDAVLKPGDQVRLAIAREAALAFDKAGLRI